MGSARVLSPATTHCLSLVGAVVLARLWLPLTCTSVRPLSTQVLHTNSAVQPSALSTNLTVRE